MELVVDTNVLFALPRSSRVRKLVDKLLERKVRLLIPQFVIDELVALKGDVMKYTGFDEEEFARFLEDVKVLFEVIPEKEYRLFLGEAKRVAPHEKDIPLFALSLKFNCPVWSREPRLRRQKVVEVLSDKEVEELLKKSSI